LQERWQVPGRGGGITIVENDHNAFDDDDDDDDDEGPAVVSLAIFVSP
jgi:hypothetical protein